MEMNDDQIMKLIQDALFSVASKRKKEFENLTLDTKIASLSLDSIATMEMVGYLEDQVDATFPDEELSRVSTIGHLASLVRTGRAI